MHAADYREIARKALKGKWRSALPVFLLFWLIKNGFGFAAFWRKYFSVERTLGSTGIVYQIPVGVGWLLLALVLALSVLGWIALVGLYRVNGSLLDGELPSARQLFPMKLAGRAILMGLCHALLTRLAQLPVTLAQWVLTLRDNWLLSLLLCAMGIALLVWMLCYSMAEFIMASEPGIGPIQALRQSRIRMRGRKWKFFCLEMSFAGWILLFSISSVALDKLLPEVLGSYVSILLGVPLQLYMQLSFTAFFRSDLKPKKEHSQTNKGEANAAGGAPDDASYRRVTALTADETVARDVFVRHGCSRNRMREAGILEEYEKLNVDSSFEPRWLREYANGLMLRFDRGPAALDEILDLAAEYAMDDLLTRALERIERHIRQETLPAEEVLDMAGRVLALVVSGKFADRPDFVRRRRAQVSDIADRLERRLREGQGGGSWQRALELIRQMCE